MERDPRQTPDIDPSDAVPTGDDPPVDDDPRPSPFQGADADVEPVEEPDPEQRSDPTP